MPGGEASLGRVSSLVGAVAAVAAVGMLCPAGAVADDCSIEKVGPTDPGNALTDAGGYVWDIEEADFSSEYYIRSFSTFDDGSSNGPAGNPPSPRLAFDSYDEWPPLYIGTSTDDAPLSTSYNSPDDESCIREDGGRELVFPKLTINGLQVQRKLFVAASGQQGARTLILVTNPNRAPVTTSVQLGGTNINDGDLGPDGDNAVRSSSSGDASFTPADLWAVTSDHHNGATNGALALAHVVDGQGGLDRVDAVNALPPPDLDDLVFRWQGVTILPGQTATFIEFEVQQVVADANAAAEDAAAASQAQAIENAVPKAMTRGSGAKTSLLYSGMSAREIGSLRNWPSGLTCFGRAPTIVGGNRTNDIITGTAGPDVIYTFGGNDKVNGLGGKDKICGIAGRDRLRGGGGKDKLDGGPGKDRLIGGKGRDRCVGGSGKDKAAPSCEKLKKIP
jgi:Ca2+-binding RTX toxin-like protein